MTEKEEKPYFGLVLVFSISSDLLIKTFRFFAVVESIRMACLQKNLYLGVYKQLECIFKFSAIRNSTNDQSDCGIVL